MIKFYIFFFVILRSSLTKRNRGHNSFLHWVKRSKICANHNSMRNCQARNHKPNHSCRKTWNEPQNIHPRLKIAKKARITATIHYAYSSDSWYPKLNYSDTHIKTEKYERSLITMSDTSLCPHTMMVKFINALPACTAMWDSGKLVEFTFLTDSSI